jgi:hypothetical protein
MLGLVILELKLVKVTWSTRLKGVDATCPNTTTGTPIVHSLKPRTQDGGLFDFRSQIATCALTVLLKVNLKRATLVDCSSFDSFHLYRSYSSSSFITLTSL